MNEYGPVWRWSWWEVPGLIAFTGGNVFGALANGCLGLARECVAAANYSRQTAELREAQRLEAAGRAEIERSLQSMLGVAHQARGDES